VKWVTLLIADDNVQLRQMLRNMLTKHFRANLAVFECGTGAEAIALARTHKPRWVFMDIKMPEMDGFSAAEQILRARPETRIIIVTSYGDAQFREEAHRLGLAGYVLKDNLLDLLTLLPKDDGLECTRYTKGA
jgi:two-component system response regulator YesN